MVVLIVLIANINMEKKMNHHRYGISVRISYAVVFVLFALVLNAIAKEDAKANLRKNV